MYDLFLSKRLGEVANGLATSALSAQAGHTASPETWMFISVNLELSPPLDTDVYLSQSRAPASPDPYQEHCLP